MCETCYIYLYMWDMLHLNPSKEYKVNTRTSFVELRYFMYRLYIMYVYFKYSICEMKRNTIIRTLM